MEEYAALNAISFPPDAGPRLSRSVRTAGFGRVKAFKDVCSPVGIRKAAAGRLGSRTQTPTHGTFADAC